MFFDVKSFVVRKAHCTELGIEVLCLFRSGVYMYFCCS
ncbi:hypothetical protein AD21_3021 [Escherichia coli 6-319-05_S4_C2]|nr:hypothetical protein AD21_3021 [Escherichia coli 6-319-05_S4_C2]